MFDPLKSLYRSSCSYDIYAEIRPQFSLHAEACTYHLAFIICFILFLSNGT